MLEAHGNQQSGRAGVGERCPDSHWIKSPTRANQSAKGMSWVGRLRVASSDSILSARLNPEIQVISSHAGRLCDDSRW
jgi:hypothetical protein